MSVRCPIRPTLALCCMLAMMGAFALSPQSAAHKKDPADEQTLRSAAHHHGILISAAATPAHLSDPEYSAILGGEFSALEPENAMKFALIHPRPNTDPQPYDFAPAERLVRFAQDHDMQVRGHTLVWHRQVPDWVTHGNFTPAQLNSILRDHITKVVRHFGDDVFAYDVVNEAFNDDGSLRSTLWYDQPGIGFANGGTKYIEQAFEWAHAANANAKLFYNDFDNETINKKSDAIYEMARDFHKRGVPLAGIGFQMHIGLDFDDPDKLHSLADNLDRFAKLGLEIHITELDIRLRDGDAATLVSQAKLYGEIVHACLQQPNCKFIQTWGVTDKYSWIPQSFKGYGWGLLWDDHYQKKPAYSSVLHALD